MAEITSLKVAPAGLGDTFSAFQPVAQWFGFAVIATLAGARGIRWPSYESLTRWILSLLSVYFGEVFVDFGAPFCYVIFTGSHTCQN